MVLKNPRSDRMDDGSIVRTDDGAVVRADDGTVVRADDGTRNVTALVGLVSAVSKVANWANLLLSPASI